MLIDTLALYHSILRKAGHQSAAKREQRVNAAPPLSRTTKQLRPRGPADKKYLNNPRTQAPRDKR